MRKCTKCERLLLMTDFSKKKFHTGKTGMCSECRICAGKRMAEWRRKNRERFNAYQNNYQKNRKK